VTSHIDVVPPHIPYSISGNTIYGRGSNDAKGSVATQIQAVEELRKSGKVGDGDVGLLFVVGEEVFSSLA
jgi:acetylornithine deacetylase